MARPLEKKNKQTGDAYKRPPEIAQAIDNAIKTDTAVLAQRASISDRSSADFVPSECLVYVIRDAWRRHDEAAMNALLPPLLVRCEAILKAKIPDGSLPDVDHAREEILSDFSLLFIEDGTGRNPHELDFFECRFNRAFRAFRLDYVRSERTRLKPVASLPAPKEAASDIDEDAFARVTEAFRSPATQADDLFRKSLLDAINNLPADERQAVFLCHVLGYKEESENPSVTTAASLAGVTGRTIRNRLARAAVRLSHLKKEANL